MVPMQATCLECKIEFSRKASQIAKYPKSFCSRKCKGDFQHRDPVAAGIGPKLQQSIPCARCAKPCIRTPATILGQVFCSRECASSTQFGKKENHFKWRGGISPYPLEFTKWTREKIRKRDSHKCRHCGKSATKKNRLEVHHRDEDKTNNSDCNLVTLCRRCHNDVHLGRIVSP